MSIRAQLMLAPVMVLATVLIAQAAAEPPYKVVCYFVSWAVYRPGLGSHDVEDIDFDLCTHHIYTFAGLNTNHQIHSLDPFRDLYDNYGEGAYLRFTGMKETHPQIKTMISIGGWNDGSYKYSEMAASAEYRANFVQSVVDFLAKYNFDGLDFDWVYPTRGGAPEDKENFILLLKDLSEALRPRGLLLSAAVSGDRQIIEPAYNLDGMGKYLDFMNVMSYDYTGDWNSFIRHHAAMFLTQKDIEHGEPYQWFSVLCERIFSQSGWKDVYDGDMQAIYSYNGTDWIGWDDLNIVKLKLDYLKSIGLGGAMLWSIDTDDFRGLCGPKYAIANLIWSELNGAANSEGREE